MMFDHAGLTGAAVRARPWRWLVGAILALVLAGCGGGEVPVPGGEGTRVEGRVVAQNDAVGFSTASAASTAYQLTAYDRRGNRLDRWSTTADGSYRRTLQGQAPFRIEAASEANDVPLVAVCDGRGTVHCDITPWTSLIARAAEDSGDSPAGIAARLYASPAFDLEEGQDPFLLYRDGELEPGRFDVDAVLTLMATPDGLDQWLTAMSQWLAAPDPAASPVGVPRITLTPQVSAGGSLDPATRAVARGDVATFQVQPAEGYHLLTISGCDGEYDADAGTFTTGMITGACAVSADFEINRYDLTYGAGANGSLSGSATQRVDHGADGTPVTAVAASGYHFVQWSDGATNNPRQDLALTGDLTVTASFAINRYDLSYGAGANGSLSGPTSQQLDHGQTGGAVLAIPDTGYHFVRWSDNRVENPRTDGPVTGDITVTAQFAINEYQATYSAGSGGTVSGTITQTVAHGGNTSAVTAVPDEGYRFVDWSDGRTDNPRTDSGVTQAFQLQARFELKQYSLSYSSQGNGTLQGQTSQTVSHGSDGSAVTAQPDTGYEFVEWSDGGTANPRTDTGVTADLTVSARFTILQYALSYSAGNGGSLTGNPAQTVDHGADGSAVTATADTGYHFVQWSDGVTTATRQDSGVTGPLTVTATFAINQYSMSYTASAGGTIDGEATQTVDHGGDASTVTAVPDTGYRFLYWSDGYSLATRTDTGITAARTLHATFGLKEYSLTYGSQGHGSVQGQTEQTVSHGGDGSAVTALPETGYEFAQWSDGVTANPRTDTNVVADLTVSAQFSLRQYALTYGAGTGGNLSGDAAQTVDHGGAGSAVQAVPDTGYQFVKWSDGVTANPRTDSNVSADLNVLAEFERLEFTLTYSAATGGALNGTAVQTVAYGDDGTAVEAVPDTGYAFSGWSDGGSANPRTDGNVTANLTVQAQFTVLQYALSYSAGTGGSLSGSASQTVDHGSDGSAVLAVADTGYHFVQWSDGGTANPRTDADVGADLTVQAQFAINQYTLTYAASTGGTVSGVSPQTVTHGEDGSEVTAVADTGYHFEQWSDGVTENPRTDTGVTASLSVTAQFAREGLELAVDEKYFAALATGEQRILNSGTEAAEYLLMPMNLTRSDQALPISVSLTDGETAPGVTSLSDATLNGAINERAAQKADALARLGTVGAGTPLPGGAGIPAGVPQVGDIWQMNVNLTDTCDAAVVRNAEVKVVSTHAVILADVDNPAGGFPVDNGQNNYDYTEIASIFDATVYPAVTDLLGDTPDRDGNGRVVLFYTRAINELDPPASSISSLGRYLVRDRLSPTECPTSNDGEVLYMQVPDPTGAVNSNVRTVSSVMGGTSRQAGMEMALMIADDRQLQAGSLLPEGWLDNGLATLASGSLFYQTSYGLAPLYRIGLSDLTTGTNASRRVAAFNTYQNLMFGEWRGWLQNPWRTGLISTSERDTRSRGLAWAFLRYVSDRQAVASNDPPLVSAADAVAYQLAGSGQDGWDTLDGITSGATGDWLRDFLLAVYLDGLAGSPVAGYSASRPYRMESWNFSSVYGGLGGLPLTVQPLTVGSGRSLNLAGAGGALYLRFSVAAGGSVMLEFNTNPVGGEDARYALVRLK
ncbi:MAG: InlB B-repeat-containing protein [Alcanivorax sp.]|uniref:InlB B-repeat-containing protein n=1 Tax=Alloalcanivorax marinus TaxID=1177169 RepID=UPI00195D627C|nr:InlB B-repeat-containing protein [Alloalcanivorax marinus]